MVSEILKIIWPIIAIQLIIQIYCIIDVVRRKKTRNLQPAIWIIIIVFGEILGSIIYLLVGRSED